MLITGLVAFPFIVTVIAVTYALWRTTRLRSQLVVHTFVLVTVISYVVLIPLVAFVSLLVHQWQHPTDDWNDIVFFGTGVVLLLLTPCLAMIVWWIGGRLERSRQATYPNVCPNCGYDLTGIASNICPECGQERLRDVLK